MSGAKTQENKNTIKNRSIFRRIVRPLIVLTILDAVLLIVVLRAVGVLSQLNQNSYDIFKKHVDNRQSYLQAQMVGKWMQLEDLSGHINECTASLLRSGRLELDQLDSKPSVCAPIISEVMDDLIAELYSKQVSGIFITFNTHDLQAEAAAGNWQEKTGIYIRDNDPLSASSERYADLLLECAPVSVVQSMNLSTDSRWEQRFKFSAQQPYGDWLVLPYTTAAASDGKLNAEDCGYWSIRQDAYGTNALSYTIPLILPDGRVYGILGVDMLPSYLSSQLPGTELDKNGVYAFFQSEQNVREDGSIQGTLRSVSSKSARFQTSGELTLQPSHYGGFRIEQDGTDYEVALTQLSLYSRNAPFEQQHWYVLGAVPSDSLFAFTNHVRWMLIITVVLMLMLGFGCALLASWHIARPVVSLRKEMGQASKERIPRLSLTGIREVDDFAEAIIDLSRDVVNSSRRFLSIMEMSSIDMGGYELDEQSGFLFVTDNFFQLFGMNDVSPAGMTVAEFRRRMAQIADTYPIEQTEGGSIFSVAGNRYIHVQETQADSRRIGVAEDVTIQVLERKRIEHERDYDILTGIYNRRAFYRDAGRLLEKPEALGVAIVVMIDLDNLKILNDTYGHEWGDRYIVAGARCIQEHVPASSVIARVSGDEFNLLLYGFGSRQAAADAVEQLQKGFNEACFLLPDGKVRPIGASGGVCFVGDDTADLKQLIKYADFAMYLVKHGRKGFFGMFDRNLYHASEIEQSKHRAFKQVVREEKIHYVFQPIVNAHTGAIHAVEALMRVQDPEIVNTEEFLRIARQENMLDEIEHLTWHHALAAFHRLIETGVVSHKTRVFVNSQVSQILSPAEQKLLIDRFGDIRENTVMEIVETDDYSVELTKLRDREQDLFALEFALDDFGTGYNNEKNLLELMPQYVKLDMTLVRDVEKHADRRKLIENLISFAHERNMAVLAEGIETPEELRCLLSLGVDMLQGFLLARPSDHPGEINPAALELIQEMQKSAV